MKTILKYYKKGSNVESNCGDILDIKVSSRNFEWDGVLLERGTSKYFYPKEVETPNFYFAVEMEKKYTIKVNEEEKTILKETIAGDIWINPPNTPFTHNVDEPCSFIILTIDKEKMFNSFRGKIPKEVVFLNNYSVKDEVLLKIIELMYIEVKRKNQNGSWYIESLVTMLSNYFIRNYSNYSDIENKKEDKTLTDKNIDCIEAYIKKNISKTITIEELAEEVNMSKFYFLREFKEAMGRTPYQYILSMKIKYSKQLLEENKESLTDIAFILGFNDSSHFSKTFKVHEGISPREFRKNFLQKR